jgi:tetratricopeptide (TPR) repeat protein
MFSQRSTRAQTMSGKPVQFHGAPLLAQKAAHDSGPKIEGLPDDHSSKPECLFELARLFDEVGNQAECKRLLTHALGLWREREQAVSLQRLAWLLYYDKQLDAAEETASRSINLLPDNSEQFTVCQGHRLLGNIYRSKGEAEKAIDHLEAALKIASYSNWQSALFWSPSLPGGVVLRSSQV